MASMFIFNKLMPSKINGTAEQIPLRMQFTDEAGNVMVDSKFPVNDTDQFCDYKVDFYSGDLDAKFITLPSRLMAARKHIRSFLNSGSLKVRGNKDRPIGIFPIPCQVWIAKQRSYPGRDQHRIIRSISLIKAM